MQPQVLTLTTSLPVIACEAVNGKGVIELRLAMSRTDLPLPRHAWDIPAAIAPAVAELQASLVANGGRVDLATPGGWVHDAMGFVVFVVAFVLMFFLEGGIDLLPGAKSKGWLGG